MRLSDSEEFPADRVLGRYFASDWRNRPLPLHLTVLPAASTAAPLRFAVIEDISQHPFPLVLEIFSS